LGGDGRPLPQQLLSRGFEEALMRAKIPYRLVGDVGFYARAEIKDALALLRLAAMPDDRQSNEAFRRVINEPRRGFGAKAIEILEQDASFFDVSLLKAVETAALPPKTKEAGVQFVKHIRVVAGNTTLTLADHLSLLLDRTWDPNACGGSNMPVNVATGHRYRGVNLFVLSMSPDSTACPTPSPARRR
jgi:superfamily I DNA/RNA helicase